MTATLILGGARSGKSRLAESLAHGEKHYIATAQAFDEDMRARIAAHKIQRGDGWVTHEEHLALPQTLAALDGMGRFILVDCLTLWLSNLMLAELDWEAPATALAKQLAGASAEVVLVSNEVGWGIVPDTALGRRFRDAQGLLNQRIVAVADRVVLVAAGLPLVLKGQWPEPPKQRA